MPIQDATLINVTVDKASKALDIKNVNGFVFDTVTINGKPQPSPGNSTPPAPLPTPQPMPTPPPAPTPAPHFIEHDDAYCGTSGASATVLDKKGVALDKCAAQCVADEDCTCYDHRVRMAHAGCITAHQW